MMRELECILDASGEPLSKRVVRYSAYDAQVDCAEFVAGSDVYPFYTLGEQLFVEPQPDAIPDDFDLTRPIRMSQAEIAVAYSHIGVWKAIAVSGAAYSLVLEDDVWFERSFGRIIDQAWREMQHIDLKSPQFDILYASYREVRHGAPKQRVSKHIFRPERGLWYMSGYVLTNKGAQALLGLLPSHGPIDLWINHKFQNLEVRALCRSVINQRRDLHSTNSYSILPSLSGIGILDNGDGALFHHRPIHSPVFVFGTPGSGLSALAMALAMLGYRCCSDLNDIPDSELQRLLEGSNHRVFDAYVNIGSLEPRIPVLTKRFRQAKYIVIEDLPSSADHDGREMLVALEGADVIFLRREDTSTWHKLCEHLKMAPPDADFPVVRDIAQRTLVRVSPVVEMAAPARRLRSDLSPWIAKPRSDWIGITANAVDFPEASGASRVSFEDEFAQIQCKRWMLRSDTFPGNLGLFRPDNVTFAKGGGLSLAVIEEPLGVRNLSAAAISSRTSFIYGRFQATIKATRVPGLVTGFFLHRNSPRQEIDVEICGNKRDHLMVNVFYNPGADGAKFDYGNRGTPAIINLGFDASEALHQFAIEWDPGEIRWFVDEKLVHRRAIWDPTPIPDLPMTLHVNNWPTRSRALAGRLAMGTLPASAIVRRVAVNAYAHSSVTI